MLTNKKAIIFDMDGSLVDSMWLWTKVDDIYMEKYHLTMPEHFHKEIEGMSFTETAEYFLETFPQLNCTVEEIKQEWQDLTMELYCTQVPLKPGAGEFLKRMKEKGILLGIATSNARELAEAVLEALHIRSYFDTVRTSCEVAKGKPAPDVYLKAAEDLHVIPEECLVFEDVPSGILAGKNAGMTVCAVDDYFSKPYEQEKRNLADYYIYDYAEVNIH